MKINGEFIMKITIDDIAKLAGVSISTVSLVINNKEGVAEETRQKVLDAIEKTNYEPNHMAQGLVTNTTKQINLIISSPEYKYLTHPKLYKIIHNISQIVNESDYFLSINIIKQQQERSFIKSQIRKKMVDAIILVGVRMSNDELVEIGNYDLPIITIGRYFKEADIYSVICDDFKGGYLATKHLINKGHQVIGYIGQLSKISTPEERLRGYKTALQEENIDIYDRLIKSANFYRESGYNATEKMLEENKEITAIFCGNDLMAFGAIDLILEKGFSVPEDISIIGFDNIECFDQKIPLTTIQQPMGRMGEIAGQKTVDLLNSFDNISKISKVDVELIERKSTSVI